MDRTALRARIAHHLHVLVEQIGPRPPGSPANRRACAYVTGALGDAGLEVRTLPFRTRWWEPGSAILTRGADRVTLTPNPYSPACDVTGPVVRATALDQLEGTTLAGRVLVLDGPLVREPLLPRVFPFVSGDHRLVEAVEAAGPAAVVTVADQPTFEDPDLSIPSVTVPPTTRPWLMPDATVRLRITGAVHAGAGVQPTARTPGTGPRLAVCAHLDSKATTPGAFDNAGGVAVLLALAEAGLDGLGPIELVPFNGEDHADACGEQAWLAATDLREIVGAVNIDGVGLAGQGTSLATLAAPPALIAELDALVERRPGWVRTAPWMESDHAIFAMRGIPAVACTSEDVHALMGGLAHTPRDTIDVVDLDVLVDVVDGARQVLHVLRRHLGPDGDG